MEMGGMIPQIVLNDDTARARVSDPVTSHEAADSTVDVRTASHSEVLVILHGHEYTAEHIVAVHEHRANTGHCPRRFSGSRLRTALTELEASGRVRRTGRYGQTYSGRRAELWEVAL